MPYENPPSHQEIEQGVKALDALYDRLPDCTTSSQAKSLLRFSERAAHEAVETRGLGGHEAPPLGLG